jgi:hypothetical protein
VSGGDSSQIVTCIAQPPPAPPHRAPPNKET